MIILAHLLATWGPAGRRALRVSDGLGHLHLITQAMAGCCAVTVLENRSRFGPAITDGPRTRAESR